MKLSELTAMLNRHAGRLDDDPEIVVDIQLPFSTIGPSPSVPVKTVGFGFDWNKGKFFIYPMEKLTKADNDFREQFLELQKKYGWMDYENRNLKKEVKRLEKRVMELEK